MLVLGLWVAGSVCAGIGWCAHALLLSSEIADLERELDEVYAELCHERTSEARARLREAGRN
jgi:hypothetical protein